MARIYPALLLILLPWIVLAADDSSLKLKDLMKKAKQIERKYLSEEKNLKTIDREVSEIRARQRKVEDKIRMKKEQIAEYDRQIRIYEAELNVVREKMRRQWVMLYKNASIDMVTVYFGHEKYAGYVNAVLDHHAKVFHDYRKLQEGLQATRQKADTLTGLLKQDLDELQGTARELKAERSKKVVLISSLKGESRMYRDKVEDLLKEIQRKEKERKEREKREREKRERARKQKEKKGKGKVGKEKKQEPLVASGGFFMSKGKLPWPVKGKVVRGFGPFTLGGVLQRSQGLDIEVADGSPVKTIYKGQVVYTGWVDKFGNTVIVDHGDGFYSVYGHLGEVLKSMGGEVSAQEVIARAGQSGDVVRPMLHFEIRFHQKAQDPHTWLGRE